MSVTFTLPDPALVVEKVREIAAERPDYVYPAPAGYCVYFAGPKEPGCLIGQALARLGVTLANLYAAGIDNNDGVGELYPLNPEQFWLANVQAQQDAGDTWAAAVEFADGEEFDPADDYEDDDL